MKSSPLSRLIFIVLLGVACIQQSYGQTVKPPQITITPSAPVAVPAGGSYQFTASGTGPLTWSLIGPGTIDQTGHYAAPPSVRAQNQSRGCQELPNNSPYNIPVDGLPVDPHSARWVGRIAGYHPEIGAYHHPIFYSQVLAFYDNVVDATTPQEPMTFAYPDRSNGYQGASFPIPLPSKLLMESGLAIDPFGGQDRHLFTMSSVDCTATEIYNLYVDFENVHFTPGNPTQVTWTTHSVLPPPQNSPVYLAGGSGPWVNANGSYRLTVTGTNSATLPINSLSWGAAPPSMQMMSSPSGPQYNSQGGQKFSPASYAQLGGVDAASMPVGALSLKLEEWYAATHAGRSDLGHARRITFWNGFLSDRSIWPALGSANTQFLVTNCVSSNGSTICTVESDLSAYAYGPCPGYTYTPGCQFPIAMYGINSSSGWAALNGDELATAIDAYHFSLPVNSAGFGSFPHPCGTYSDPCFLVPDYIPYGATIRMDYDTPTIMAAMGCTQAQLADLTSACAAAAVLLENDKKYGYVVADGTVPADDGDSSTIASEFHPKQLVDASNLIRNAAALVGWEQYMQVVNRSSQQLSRNLSSWLMTPVGRVTVKVCNAAGCASTDVLLQGTTVGSDRERVTIACGGSYQLNAWVHGNANPAVSYGIDSGIPGASVSATGLVTLPACGLKQQGMVKLASVGDPTAVSYVQVDGLPRASDGGLRMALGNYSGDYLDSLGKNWSGAFGACAFNNSYAECSPWLDFATENGSWQGYGSCANDAWAGADSQLFSRSTDQGEDTKLFLAGLRNGTYDLALYAEPGFGGFGPNNTCPNAAGQNVWDFTVQGQTKQSEFQCLTQNGGRPFVGCTLTAQATVTDGTLSVIGRIRVPSTYGMSWSSLLIKPAPGPTPGPSIIHRVLNGLGLAAKTTGSAMKSVVTGN